MFTFSMIGYKNSRKVDYAYGPEVKDTTDLSFRYRLDAKAKKGKSTTISSRR